MNTTTTPTIEIAQSDRFHSLWETSFGGVPAAQYWVDFYLWEGILNDTPEANAIVELGTLQGGFSLYLAAQAEARGLIFRTFDVAAPKRRIPGFVQLDIFACAEEIGEYLSSHEPLILFCDNGNKPRELKTFSLYLSPRSLIVVHDWETEVFPEDVPSNVHMVLEDFCVEIGSLSRVFRVND